MSPHASLFATPSGCLVCHASADGLFSVSERLDGIDVESTVCTFCHADGMTAALQMNAGDPNYGDTRASSAHSGSSIDCKGCHTIHGPAVSNPLLAEKLLRVLDYQPQAVAACDLNSASHDRALSVWCTGCHRRWPAAPKSGAASCSNHPFGAAGGRTAWRDCQSCLDCHGAPGFPHYTPGAELGLVGASSAASKPVGVRDSRFDVVCLACHRSGPDAHAPGVGESF